MPTVPSLESPQVEAEALPGRAFPRVDDTVTPAAFGTPIAQGLDEIAHAATTEQAKQKVQNDNLRVIDANTQLEAGRNALLYGTPDKDGNLQGGAFSMRGLDAMNMPAKLIPQYQKMASDISNTLTPDQQRLFTNHVAQGQNELNLQLNRYEFEESNRLSQAVYSNASKQAIQSASIGYADPAVVGKSRADIKALVQLQGDREGWDPSQRDEQTQKLLAEMHYSVVDRMLADGNPQAALAYFVGTKDEPGIRDSKELTGQESHQIGSTIDAAIREQASQNQSAVVSKVRDVRAAAVNGQMIPPSSMPSDDELKSAYPNNWQEVKGAINRDVQMGSDLKTMSAMSPEQMAETVKGYEPNAVTGAAEQYERYNAVREAASRIQSQRAADPRQYAIDNHLGSAPLDFRDPSAVGAELRDRASTQGVLSNHLGGAVPLLSKSEAATLAQTLDAQKPADRLGTLYSLAQSIGDDRAFQQVMHQVAPGSPTTAIVGNQVVAANPKTPPVWFDRQFSSDPTTQAKILQGESLLHPVADEKGEKREVFPMPAEGGTTGLKQQFAQAAGDLFRNRPELTEPYYQAFKDAYASLLSDKGDVSGNGNSTLQRQALKMALGNVSKFNGQQVSIPQGMDPTRFEGLVGNAVRVKLNGTRPDLIDMQAAPGSPGTNPEQWDKRPDGSQKGNGWLGLLRRPDGGVSSEISVGVQMNGKETDIPLLVPGLTRAEVQKIVSLPNDDNLVKNLPEGVLDKARAFAQRRVNAGLSPFASPEESPRAQTGDQMLAKIKGYQLQEVGDLGSGRYRLLNGTVPLVDPARPGTPFQIDLKQDYLPDRAHGSPEDKTRAVTGPASPAPAEGTLEGTARLQKPEATGSKPVNAPTVHTGGAGGRGAREHPSQGPSL